VKNSVSKRLALVLAASLAASVCWAADDPDSPNGGQDAGTSKKSVRQAVSSSVKPSEKAVPRIWIGLTGSYTPLKQIKANNSGNLTDSNGDTFTATSAQGLAGGGAIVNVRILHGFGLSLGAIYRFTGYDANDAVNDVNGTVEVERTRVRLLDLPLMVRYSGKKWNAKHTFYELGGVVRQGFSIQTTTNVVDGVNGELGPGPTSGTTFKHRIFGAVAGAGLIGRDDFGIVVSPEVRYTRWMEDTFSSSNISGLLNSNKNQLEVTVSFGF
jgi:outer membrane protein with beta-barrel domain